MLSVCLCPKVITLSGFNCTYLNKQINFLSDRSQVRARLRLVRVRDERPREADPHQLLHGHGRKISLGKKRWIVL
jgi:hypothetical protein